MIMKLLWLFLIYFLTGLIVNSQSQQFSSQKRSKRSSYIKPRLVSFLIGLGGVMVADWLSDGNPLWPAMGLITGVVGTFFPISSRPERSFNNGMVVYFGGVFYLKPVIALISFSIALEGLFWSKDRILTAILFCSILPVLFSLSQVNPFFLQATVIIQILFLIEFRDEIHSKFSELFKTQKSGNGKDKI